MAKSVKGNDQQLPPSVRSAAYTTIAAGIVVIITCIYLVFVLCKCPC